jgi:3-methyladenine DNA glycosylase/8-oxoguanine DNA glycosylase
MIERRAEIRPAWMFRLPRHAASDGTMRCRGGVLERLIHVEGEPVVVRAAQPSPERVVVGAQAERPDLCEEGLARMRFALGVDEDLSDFHERFRWDPLIGGVVRSAPWLRPMRRPEPFEALAWAVTEQLIDYPRAAAIQRRIVFRLGRRCERTGLRDLPDVATLAAQAPAQLEAFDLAARRSIALVRVAREVAAGRVDLHDADHERGWARLLRIPNIGRWTIEILALHGQGRLDCVPAGDLNLIKLAGRLLSGGDPYARAGEDEVREVFAPYGPYAGLAAVYALKVPRDRLPLPAPHRAGTRSSARAQGPLAA